MRVSVTAVTESTVTPEMTALMGERDEADLGALILRMLDASDDGVVVFRLDGRIELEFYNGYRE